MCRKDDNRWVIVAGVARCSLAAVLFFVAACEPTVPASASAVPSASPQTQVPTPAQTAMPVAVAPEPTLVYFARLGLPPLLASVPGHAGGPTGTEARISNRLSALWEVRQAPPDATNPFGAVGRSGASGALSTSIRIDGDLATITFDVASWGPATETAARALVQQIVYTATEEEGVRRVLLAQRGASKLVIAGVSFDAPLTREDVAGYSFLGTKTPMIVGDGTSVPSEVVSWTVVNEQTAGSGRLVVELRARDPATTHFAPQFTVNLMRCDFCGGGEGKWWIALDLPDTARTTQAISLPAVSAPGPIRDLTGPPVVDSAPGLASHAHFVLRVDDARPWRASTDTTGPNTARVVIDVGGRPSTLNANIAVYLPVPDQGAGDRAAGCASCRMLGAARVFEANVLWRVRDGTGREVSHGSTTASRGTSPVWGLFDTQFTIPPNVAGTPVLEVFWQSPRDGSDQDVVAIPLTLH